MGAGVIFIYYSRVEKRNEELFSHSPNHATSQRCSRQVPRVIFFRSAISLSSAFVRGSRENQQLSPYQERERPECGKPFSAEKKNFHRQQLKFNNIRRDIDRARAQNQVENNKESLMRKIFNGPLRFIFDCRIRHTKNHDQSEVEWKVKIIKIP